MSGGGTPLMGPEPEVCDCSTRWMHPVGPDTPKWFEECREFAESRMAADSHLMGAQFGWNQTGGDSLNSRLAADRH